MDSIYAKFLCETAKIKKKKIATTKMSKLKSKYTHNSRNSSSSKTAVLLLLNHSKYIFEINEYRCPFLSPFVFVCAKTSRIYQVISRVHVADIQTLFCKHFGGPSALCCCCRRCCRGRRRFYCGPHIWTIAQRTNVSFDTRRQIIFAYIKRRQRIDWRSLRNGPLELVYIFLNEV